MLQQNPFTLHQVKAIAKIPSNRLMDRGTMTSGRTKIFGVNSSAQYHYAIMVYGSGAWDLNPNLMAYETIALPIKLARDGGGCPI